MPDPLRVPSIDAGLRDHFTTLLIMDVDAARDRFLADDTQSSRRDLVRTIFAAIDGMTWFFKETIVEAALLTEHLTTAERIVLSERIPVVAPNGVIQEQERFIPLKSMIRLTTGLARRIDPNIDADFGTTHWSQFQLALAVRHRVTHPKSRDDLTVSSEELMLCRAAFDWLFDLALRAMAGVIEAQRGYAAQFSIILDELKQGDAETWAEYVAAGARISARS